jgi:energy-coupling factor transporter ATP-binding protein EcfA2
MIHQVEIENFKSIGKVTLDLGRVNVVIGENGCGKSNLLEALAFASAAANDKLDNEFLAARGVRVTEPRFMMAAFPGSSSADIHIRLREERDGQSDEADYRIYAADDTAHAVWRDRSSDELQKEMEALEKQLRALPGGDTLKGSKENGRESGRGRASLAAHYAGLTAQAAAIASSFGEHAYEGTTTPRDSAALATALAALAAAFAAMASRIPWSSLERFLIYSPENSSLRAFQLEGQTRVSLFCNLMVGWRASENPA